MAGYYSPHAASAQEFAEERYSSPGYHTNQSATPSPRAPAYFAGPSFPAAQTPQRPATRASHFRHVSSGYEAGSSSPRNTLSPRFNSGGQYVTGDHNVSSTRKNLWSSTPSPIAARSKDERRSSFSYRASTPHGESDEDEYFKEMEAKDVAYVIPGASRARRSSNVIYFSRGSGTDHHRYGQFAFPDDERKTTHRHSAAAPGPPPTTPVVRRYSETPGPDGARRSGHTRRPSAAVAHPIPRPQTARPEASRRPEHTTSSRRPAEAVRHHHSSRKTGAHPPPAPTATKATDEDAKRCGIPPGYSLKNWDPNEEPILLLGSVFDSNSLGKWIYDWTVHTNGQQAALTGQAGTLWLLLIQLAGKTKRAMKAVPLVRRRENKEIVEDFINAGERLTDKLRDLLVSCEQPMLEASKKGSKSKLGKGAGIEFIETLFGSDRMLHQTEKFMKAVDLWNLRYDANVDEIIAEPTK